MKATMFPAQLQKAAPPVTHDNADRNAGKMLTPPTFHLKDKLAVHKSEPTDAERWEKIKAILEQTPTGKEALKRKDDLGIPVSFDTGHGSRYDNGTIIIDTKKTPAQSALTFVHEMNHAHRHKNGMQADIETETREGYISKMIDEEAEGVVKSIACKMELEGTKVNTKGLSYPLEQEYRKAYKKAYKKAKKDKKADAEAIGRAAGVAVVKQGFMDGKVFTSTDLNTYPIYYGDIWDMKHKDDPK
jgi:hypothetical protein